MILGFPNISNLSLIIPLCHSYFIVLGSYVILNCSYESFKLSTPNSLSIISYNSRCWNGTELVLNITVY